MTNLQSVGIIVGVLTGIAGLVLGIINYVDSRRAKQPRLFVALAVGVTTGPAGQQLVHMTVTGVNTGLRTVRVEEGGALLPDGRKMVFWSPRQSDSLPAELTDGQSCEQRLDIVEVARKVKESGYGMGVKLIGYMRDARGVHHQSRPMAFDPDEWLPGPAT